jgi:hypothetical protein
MKVTKTHRKNGSNGKQNHSRLKCDLPPDEALRRALLVKPPRDWKYGKRKKATAR